MRQWVLATSIGVVLVSAALVGLGTARDAYPHDRGITVDSSWRVMKWSSIQNVKDDVFKNDAPESSPIVVYLVVGQVVRAGTWSANGPRVKYYQAGNATEPSPCIPADGGVFGPIMLGDQGRIEIDCTEGKSCSFAVLAKR